VTIYNMPRSYKWIGGIGYILSLVPYASVIASILVAVAWIMMGRDTRERVFMITGALLLASFALGIVILAMLFTAVPLLITSSATGLEIFRRLGSFLISFLVVALIGAAIALAALIFEIASHFRAGKIFQNTWLKLGGWMRIALIAAAVISIPLIITSITSVRGLAGLGILAPGSHILWTLLSALWPLIIVVVVGLIAAIFSIVGFLTIPEEAEIHPTPQQ